MKHRNAESGNSQAGNGTIDLANTVIECMNPWSPGFGLNGDFLLHASTLNYLSRRYFSACIRTATNGIELLRGKQNAHPCHRHWLPPGGRHRVSDMTPEGTAFARRRYRYGFDENVAAQDREPSAPSAGGPRGGLSPPRLPLAGRGNASLRRPADRQRQTRALPSCT